MENKNTNFTPRMTTREKAMTKIAKLCFDKHGVAVNRSHITKQMERIKIMDVKKVK